MQNDMMQGAGAPMPGKSSLPWVIGTFVALVVVGALYFVTRSDEKMEGDAMMEASKDSTMIVEEKNEKTDDGAMMEGAGSYETYEASKLAMAKEGKVVLFFRASWCPTCRALDASIRKEASAIPGSLTILDVDYDTYKDLKTKYGVTTQHTLVQVDADGREIMKWVGSENLAELVAKLK